MKRYPSEAMQPAEAPASFEPAAVQEALASAPRQQPLPFEYTPSAPAAGMPPVGTPAEFELSQQHLDSMRVSNRVLQMLSSEPSKTSVDTQEAKQSVQQASPGEPDAAPPQDESAPGDLPAAIPGPTPVVVPAQRAQSPEQSEPAPSLAPLEQQHPMEPEEAVAPGLQDALLARENTDVNALLAEVRRARRRRFLSLDGVLPLLSEEG